MQAITTKYLPATNTKPSRYKATSASGLSVTLSTDHSLDSDGNHEAAAQALCAKMGWHGRLIHGGTKEAEIFVFDDGEATIV